MNHKSGAIYVNTIRYLLQELGKHMEYIRVSTVIKMLDAEPRVEVVKRSAWANDGHDEEYDYDKYVCVKCGQKVGGCRPKYCPNCGARMYDTSYDESDVVEEEVI